MTTTKRTALLLITAAVLIACAPFVGLGVTITQAARDNASAPFDDAPQQAPAPYAAPSIDFTDKTVDVRGVDDRRTVPPCAEDALPLPVGPCQWSDEGQTVVAEYVGHGVIRHTYTRTGERRTDALDPCEYEDGSGQPACYWDAATSGNGLGESFAAFADPDHSGEFVDVYDSGKVERSVND